MVKRKKTLPDVNTRSEPIVETGTGSLFQDFGLLQDPGQFRQPYAQHPWVYATVRCIARTVKGVPLLVKQGTKGQHMPLDARLRSLRKTQFRANQAVEEDVGETVEDPSDPLVRLFERPNPLMSRAKLWEATVLQMWLSGGCVWVKVGKAGQFVNSATEQPMELWPMPMTGFRAELDQRTMLPRLWRGQWGNGEVQFQPYQLTFFQFYNPYADLQGLAPLKPASISAEADYAAMSFNAAFFQNGANVGGIIKTKANLSTPQARAVLDTWNDQFQGHRKAHKTGILTGESEYIPTTTTQKDMDFVQLRDGARREIMSTLGPVPPLLLGLSDDYTRATALEAKGVLFENTLLPEMKDMEDVLEFEIGNWTQGTRWAEWDLASVEALRDNTAGKADAASKLFELGIPLEQINSKLEMGFDTDKIEHANESFLPGTLKLVADVIAGPAQDPLGLGQPGGPLGQPGKPMGPEGGDGDPEKALAVDEAGKSKDAASREAIATLFDQERARKRPVQWHRFIRQVTDPAEAKGVSAFKRYVRDLRAWTLARVEEVVQQSVGVDRAKKKDDSASVIMRLTDAMVEQMLFNEEQWDRELRRIMGPVYKDAAGLALKHLREELGATLHVIEAEDPRVLKLLAEKEIKVVQINDTIRAKLREVLVRQVSETATISQTASEIQQTVGQALKAEFNSISGRSLAIARTETAQVANTVRAEGMVAAGVTQHEWVSAQDAHVRESHKQANGEVRVIGIAFSNGLTHPGQIGAPAEEVINCRCVAVAVIPGATS